MSALKKVIVPGYGSFAFGRKPTLVSSAPLFAIPRRALLSAAPPIDHNAIRAAAKSLHPIYSVEEDPLGNESIGDCTCAAALHIIAILQAIMGGSWREPTTADAKWLYSKVTRPPFVIATGANDNGTDLETVLSFLRSNGAYSDGSGKIASFAAVDATNPAVVRAALDANRNLYMGSGLPDAWLPKDSVPKVWGVAGPSNEANGHCIMAYDWNEQGVLVDSWGCFITITWAALAMYFANDNGELYTAKLAA